MLHIISPVLCLKQDILSKLFTLFNASHIIVKNFTRKQVHQAMITKSMLPGGEQHMISRNKWS